MSEEPLRLEIFIASPPETVFRYLVEPEQLGRWLGIRNAIDPRPGGRFEAEMEGGHIAAGSYLEIVPDRRVVFTWGWAKGGIAGIPPGSTRVEIDLAPEGGGTRLVLTHHGLAEDAAAKHRQGWPRYLSRLAGAFA